MSQSSPPDDFLLGVSRPGDCRIRDRFYRCRSFIILVFCSSMPAVAGPVLITFRTDCLTGRAMARLISGLVLGVRSGWVDDECNSEIPGSFCRPQRLHESRSANQAARPNFKFGIITCDPDADLERGQKYLADRRPDRGGQHSRNSRPIYACYRVRAFGARLPRGMEEGQADCGEFRCDATRGERPRSKTITARPTSGAAQKPKYGGMDPAGRRLRHERMQDC